jgi:integrase
MGALFHPRYTAADGTVKESPTWWIRFRQQGKTLRQSAHTTSHAKALAFLRQQEGKVALKIPVILEADRLTLADGARMITEDYATHERKSAATLPGRLAHLSAGFGLQTRLSRLTTGGCEAYKTTRLAAGARPATVNRELACLARMARLARHRYGLVVPFVVDMLTERNARQGFFEDDAARAVCARLPPHLAALAEAARLTGWRKSELRSRQWRHVDFAHGWLRLEPEETKNREGRQFPLIPELRALLEAQRASVDALQQTRGQVIPWVFAHPSGGAAGDFKRAWGTACIKAGFFRVVKRVATTGPNKGKEVDVKVPTKLFHDFRRTAVRNLVRAGIPETVAMEMTGHRTRAVFKRYTIVDEGMLREAAEKLAALAAARRSGRAEPPRGRVVSLDG